MKWLKNIINKIIRKNKIKLIEEAKTINKQEDKKSDFIKGLRELLDIDKNSGNGYKIIPIRNLDDMI